MSTEKKTTTQIVTLPNVYFYFVKIAQPQPDSFNPGEEKWQATVCISKAESKAFKKMGLNKNIKEYDGETFLSRFKVQPPAEFLNDDDEYYTVQFTQKTHIGKDLGNKPEWLQPLTYLEDAAGELSLATETLIGNGSKGDIRIRVREDNRGQLNTSLHSILVRDLIAFESGAPQDEWAAKAGVEIKYTRNTNSEVTAAPSAEIDDDLPF